MFLEVLFAWMRKYGSRSIHVVADAQGAAIKKRLRELLDLEEPIRPMPSTEGGSLHRAKMAAASPHSSHASH